MAHSAAPTTISSQNEDTKEIVRVEKVGGGSEQQEWVNYAYQRCGGECVLTFEAESGWRKDIVSQPNGNGTRDYGFCQLNSQYHSSFIKSEAFKDPYAQLDYCIGVWWDAKNKKRLKTTFYGFNVINKKPGVQDRILFHKE